MGLKGQSDCKLGLSGLTVCTPRWGCHSSRRAVPKQEDSKRAVSIGHVGDWTVCFDPSKVLVGVAGS